MGSISVTLRHRWACILEPCGAHWPAAGRQPRDRADIDRLLAENVWNAVVIFRELQTKGYTGRLSMTPVVKSGRHE
ncbi:hypothetical protein COMA1_40472 [Candidatus Nitrospira nitrosa]|uniref:Uncharacterized protein n=1 Tax=Candidatus Nitrospira nitrosa TaxID=1742972 RepID=A0A0S4LL13_9BACT|nr:hypothetical protein COMA1_40472 [Candidatus Nitrospira nitrosa]